MPLEMVPVPSRVAKQWSTWVALALLIVDVVTGISHVALDKHLMSAEVLALVNSIMAGLAVVLKFVQQNIKLTDDQKETLIEAVQDAPSKPPKPV